MMFRLLVSLSLLAIALGVPLGGRIVGGELANIEDLPYQVSLRIYDEHMCGGSIIDEYTIVTAAHCTDGFRVSTITVMVGSSTVHGGTVHKLDDIIQHPLYNEDTTDYDICILKLQTPIVFNDKAKPIALQDSNDEVAAGTVATVSGWGVLSENEEDTPEHLRRVDVDVISHEKCRSSFVNPGKITARMMCAQRANVDSCAGDSGGPLVANGKLIGVVSWGIGCARPSYPGVYSNVAYLRRWIEQNRY